MSWASRKYTKEQFEIAWRKTSSIRSCADMLGVAPNYKSIRRAAEELGLSDDDHAPSPPRIYRKGHPNKRPTEEILVKNSTYISSSDLRRRLITEGILEAKCSAPFCPVPEKQIDPWTGEEVEPHLTLDHIDGNNRNNELSNLRILCNYCHGHTSTYCGRGRGTRNKNCKKCGKSMDYYNVNLCINCHIDVVQDNSKFKGYDPNKLLEQVISEGYTSTARKIGVSANGLKKFLKTRGMELPTLKRGPIKKE